MTALTPSDPAMVPPERVAWTGFELADRVFALPYRAVERLLAATPVTPLPFAPQGIEGVANIAGDVVPVLDLLALLPATGRQQAEPPVARSAGTRFAVIRVADRRFALRIDRMLFVAAALSVAASREEAPAALAGEATWRERSVTCLALEPLGLADLAPRPPASGPPGPVADGRAAASAIAEATDSLVLAVDVAGASYGLPAASIVELLEEPAITRLPLAPPELIGVAILRGRPILALSLARLLGSAAVATPGGYVVVTVGRSRLVVAVDAVGGLLRRQPGGPPAALDLETLIAPEWFTLAAEVPLAAPAAPRADADRRRFLCVSLGGRACAVALPAVERILPARPAVRLPFGAPQGVDGVIAFDGRILPVTEGWRWLSLDQGGAAAAHVVLQHDGDRRVLAVDAIQRIVTIAEHDILPTANHDPRIAALGRAGGRSLEILSTTALMSDGGAP